MLDQDDDDLRIVLGVIFGVIALVIGLVIGLGVHVTHKPKAPMAVVVEEVFAEVEPQGDALVKVYFAVGEATVTPEALATLEQVKAALAEKDGAIVLLSGFHDETGGAAVNAEVSKGRAKAVKEALIGVGVPGEKVLLRKPAITLGGESPEEARRVEIRVQMH
ncbi:MAG: OmpA family protein [Zoogloeaceae bacterium]|nr:OmpA family protein [Zoogloeaceae bacterium]